MTSPARPWPPTGQDTALPHVQATTKHLCTHIPPTQDFITDTGVDSFPNLSDEAGDIWKKFEITQQSLYVILDRDGKTVFTGSLPAGKGLADKVSALVG